MAYNRNQCAVCDKEFYSDTRAPKAIYCSASCRQKAYRKRKKQRDEAKLRTLSFDQLQTQKTILEYGGDEIKTTLGRFYKKHGYEAYKNMLDVITSLMDCDQKA